MLRRLHPEQPEYFAFTPANEEWAQKQMAKYPQGREASAVIALLWRAQEQEGWLSRPAIEHVADMLGMPRIRALEVATFYFMFQLAPVGSVAHVQVCGTLSCMLCGSEDLVAVCKEKIAKRPFQRSEDGKFSWEEVECLGACANAPMALIGKDYYEDLDRESFTELLDRLAAGEVPEPGSRKGRFASEPEGGATTLKVERPAHEANASVSIARQIGDTVKRIDGTEPLYDVGVAEIVPQKPDAIDVQIEDFERVGEETDRRAGEAKAWPDTGSVAPEPEAEAEDISAHPAANPSGVGREPARLDEAREGGADDLRRLKGVGPKIETVLNRLGIYHFDQIAAWGPEEIDWVDAHIESFSGRITRDDWVGQAKAIVAGETPSPADGPEEDA
ncbi:MAG: NADH-quinone oxidoreductase subunit E [Paracoccaceae bacterium]